MMIKVFYLTPTRIRQTMDPNRVASRLMVLRHKLVMDAPKFFSMTGWQEWTKMKPMEESSMNNGQMKFADQETLLTL